MKIIEEYTTIQGEGKYTGVPSYFIRTTGCNLRCAWQNPDKSVTICDTPYSSFEPEKGYDLEPEKVIHKLNQTNVRHIVVTGGEPTIQPDLKRHLDRFVDAGYHTTVETNGTVYVPSRAFMSLSPKLESSHAQTDHKDRALHRKNNIFIDVCSKYMKQDYQFKFVGNDEGDLEEILNLQRRMEIPKDRIFIMPQGITTGQFKEREKMLIDFCIETGFTYSPRLHIDIWGYKRGV